MITQKKGLALIFMAGCFISLNSAADERIVKEYTTLPPSEEALPASAIPPLLTPAAKATPTESPPVTATQPPGNP